MKVILKQEIKNVGKEWDLVTVADGYARNFLLPQNLAMPATQGSVKDLERRRAKASARREQEEAAARSLAERMEGVVVTVTARSGPEGRLYGSITPAEIAQFLQQKGFDIDRRQIDTGEPIRTIGDHGASVHLYAGVDVHVKVEVQPEGGAPAGVAAEVPAGGAAVEETPESTEE